MSRPETPAARRSDLACARFCFRCGTDLFVASMLLAKGESFPGSASPLKSVLMIDGRFSKSAIATRTRRSFQASESTAIGISRCTAERCWNTLKRLFPKSGLPSW